MSKKNVNNELNEAVNNAVDEMEEAVTEELVTPEEAAKRAENLKNAAETAVNNMTDGAEDAVVNAENAVDNAAEDAEAAAKKAAAEKAAAEKAAKEAAEKAERDAKKAAEKAEKEAAKAAKKAEKKEAKEAKKAAAKATADSYDNVDWDSNKKPEKKTGFRKFIFSFLLLLLVLASVASLKMDYVTLNYKSKDNGNVKEAYTGEQLILNDVMEAPSKYVESGADSEDVDNVFKMFSLGMSGLGIILIVVGIFDIIVLLFIRKRYAYTVMMLFSLCRVAAVGFLAKLWGIDLIEAMKSFFEEYATASVKVSADFNMGFIAMGVAQILIFISYIVLMTCKNRVKK